MLKPQHEPGLFLPRADVYGDPQRPQGKHVFFVGLLGRKEVLLLHREVVAEWVKVEVRLRPCQLPTLTRLGLLELR